LIPDELKHTKILKVYKKIRPYIYKTPLIEASNQLNDYFKTNIFLKCEFLQKSGSFKARGAINNILSMDKSKLKNGITAVSAGNHAIAASYVSNLFKLKNKIFLYKSANKYRVDTCKNFNAKIIFTNPENAFKNVSIAESNGYNFIHPFDGPYTLQGSATLGLEICEEFIKFKKKIDNVIISVGGGGLVSGAGSFIKQKFPNAKIYGVEPKLANGMTQSLNKGEPLNNIKLKSIADSLSSPLHMPYSFGVAKQTIYKMINVTDKELQTSMRFAFENLKLILEPACAAGLAALKKIKTSELKNKNTVLILCGSNIDYRSWKKIAYK
tara:strand:+ start:190 stop:1164 length:975 start_codon:yes stop_codon:yes gene_type:complete